MDMPTDNATPVAEQWLEPDDDRRFAVLLRRMILMLGVVVLLLRTIFVVSIHRRIQAS